MFSSNQLVIKSQCFYVLNLWEGRIIYKQVFGHQILKQGKSVIAELLECNWHTTQR